MTPGTRTTVLLYKDQAPQGTRKVKGHFQSATPEAITLLLPGGHPYTLQKQAVRKVLVYRPLKKRYQGWVGVAISTAVWAPRIATADDVGGFWGKFLLNRAFRKIRICTWPAMGFPLGARASRPHSCKGAAPAPVGR